MKELFLVVLVSVMSHQANADCDLLEARTREVRRTLSHLEGRRYVLDGLNCSELRDAMTRVTESIDLVLDGPDFSCPLVIHRPNNGRISALYNKAAFYFESIGWVNTLYDMQHQWHCQ